MHYALDTVSVAELYLISYYLWSYIFKLDLKLIIEHNIWIVLIYILLHYYFKVEYGLEKMFSVSLCTKLSSTSKSSTPHP